MIILCDGMVRSGSTWSFNVAVWLLETYCSDRKTLGLYSETSAVLIDAIREQSSHQVIKTHNLDPSSRELCRSGAVKAIYTWRHPYDAIVSAMGIFGNSVDHWIEVLRHALQVWAFHRETESACILSYESIVQEPAAGILSIAAYLGLNADPELARQVAEEASVERVKRFSQRIDKLEKSRLIRTEGAVYDRETLLHQNHIRDGRVGHGAGLLDAEQLRAIDAMLREEGFEFLCGSGGLAGLGRIVGESGEGHQDTSFGAQGGEGVDASGAERGEQGRQDRDRQPHRDDAEKRDGVREADPEEKSFQ